MLQFGLKPNRKKNVSLVKNTENFQVSIEKDNKYYNGIIYLLLFKYHGTKKWFKDSCTTDLHFCQDLSCP